MKTGRWSLKTIVFELGISLVIVILSVFFKTFLFRLIYLAAAGTIVFTVIFFLIKRQMRFQQDAFNREKEQLAAEFSDTAERNRQLQQSGDEKTINEAIRENTHGFLQTLSQDIEEKSKIIPVLINQLKAVIEQTDEAAMNLSKSFFSINKQAKEQNNETNSIFGSLQHANGENTGNLLIEVKDVLKNILEDFKTVMMFIKKNQQVIGKIGKDTENIRQIISTIEGITENSKVLAINAAIEAARAGEQGKGFAVVASEFRKLSEDSKEANREIQEIIEHVSANTSQIIKEMDDSVKKGAELAQKTDQVLTTTLSKIDAALENTARQLEDLSGHAQQLSKDISNIVVSIQFQDITRQRIEHVIEPLDLFSQDLEAISSSLKSNQTAEMITKRDHSDWLKNQYTMEEEKLILEATFENKKES